MIGEPSALNEVNASNIQCEELKRVVLGSDKDKYFQVGI